WSVSRSRAGRSSPPFQLWALMFTPNPSMVWNFCAPLTVRATPPAFETVTVTAADVVVLPAASRARAVSVWLPLLAVVVFHETEYGAAVSSAPRLLPSNRNWTPATPTLSLALADTATVPATATLLLGLVRETVGGVVSTVTVTPAPGASRLALSSTARLLRTVEPPALGVQV